MATTKRFALNVSMNWIAMVVGMIVPFFLTPIVIRHLGTVAYGVWILAVSTVAYLGLLDLGLRSAVIRYVSKADAQGQEQEAKEAIGAALWFRILIAFAAVALSFILAIVFPHLFKVPGGLERPAQITVLMCAFAVAVTLVSGVFGAVLGAIHRFDVLSWVTVTQTAVKAIGVIVLLRTGQGLIALAGWELLVTLFAGLITWVAAVTIYPTCRVRLGRPDMKTLKKIWSYSFTTFIIVIAVQVVFNTDNIVVGAFISVGAVAFYSIGGSLVAYSRQVVSSVATTFIPMASNLEASGKSVELQRLLLKGTQATLGLALPVSLALLFRGKTFIGLWMGAKFSEEAGTVLQIEKHKAVANWAIAEAVLNLSLSILLAKTIGLYGVAWGTSIATTVIHLLFWPRFVRSELGVPIRTYLWKGWGKISLCAVPFGLACALTDRYFHPRSMAMFFGQIVAILPIYAACALWLFKDEVHSLWINWRRNRGFSVRDVSIS